MFAYEITAILLCSLTVCDLAPVGSVLDNSSDLWVLREYEETPPSQQSPPLSSRRITPKSIFIVPSFINNCPQGSQLDSVTGKCVKVVSVDEEANTNVLLGILLRKFNQSNGMGAKETFGGGSSTTVTNRPQPIELIEPPSKNEPSVSLEIVQSGPFQLPIPLNATNANDEDEIVGKYRNETTVPINQSTNTTNTTNTTAILSQTGAFVITTTAAAVPITEITTSDGDASDAVTLPFAETTVGLVSETFFTVDQNTEPIETTTIFDTISPELTANTEIVRLPSSSAAPPPPQRFREQSTTTTTAAPDPTTTMTIAHSSPPDETATFFHGDILKTSAIKFAASNTTTPPPAPSRIVNTSVETVTPVQNRPSFFVSDSNISNNNGNKGNNIVFSDSDSKNNAVSISSKGNNRELPTRGTAAAAAAVTRCDPSSGYNSDCGGHESLKVQTPVKNLYSINKPQFTSYIRFPSSFIRFPAGAGAVGHTTAGDDIQYDTGSRLWPVDGNRYSTSYWTSWDPTKSHFVRVWPDTIPAVNTYHNGGRSQSIAIS